MSLRAATCVVGALLTIAHPSVVVPQDRGPEPLDDPEAYAVYASLLPSEWSVSIAHAKTLVFQEETVSNWGCMPSGKPLETDWKPVVDSLRSANEKPRRVRTGFPLGTPYIVVPSTDIMAILKDVSGGPDYAWSGFYKRYPESGGFMTVSAVGFDAGRRRAMVYIAHACGSLCGGGMHHLLEKVDGAWREATVTGVTNCAWSS